jgi:hypothetical protein
MKDIYSVQLYYKVENKDSDLYKRANEFLAMEKKLQEIQRNAIKSKVPKFSKYKARKGFNRIVRCIGFVFDDKESIDPKVWKTIVEDGEMLSVPNLRTKVGRAMDDFLRSFKRTDIFDLHRLLAIDEKNICGNFYNANLFEFNGRIYIIIDSQFRDVFEKNNTNIIEITNGEMTKVINDYNNLCKTIQTKGGEE